MGFPLSTVNQMLGRGFRSLGVACGGYFTFELDQCVHLETILKALKPNYSEGARVMELLYLGYQDLKP
jgi:hypothetical protein